MGACRSSSGVAGSVAFVVRHNNDFLSPPPPPPPPATLSHYPTDIRAHRADIYFNHSPATPSTNIQHNSVTKNCGSCQAKHELLR